MKVHLIFAPTTYPLNHGDLGMGGDPPLGILYIASYLEKYGPKGLVIKVTDGLLEGFHKTLQEAIRENADIIGISAVTSNILGAYKLIREIKSRNPKTKVILGGPHPTAMPKEAFEQSKPDAVVISEGEVTFTELVSFYSDTENDLDRLAKIAGLCISIKEKPFMTGSRQFVNDLDTIPFPARHLIDMGRYKGYPVYKARPSTTILASRGCPFNCTYCSNNVWRSPSPVYRARSANNYVNELQELTEKWGFKEFFDISDEFNTNLSFAKEVLREIITRGLKIHLKCQLRAKPIDEEFVQLMKQAGIWYVHLGIESGNAQTLLGINKKVTFEEVERCCKLLKKYDIKIWGLFMYFNIWEQDGNLFCENYDQSMNTFNYAKKLLKTKMIDFFGGAITTPFPGSKLWDIAIRHNLIKDECKGNYDMWFYKRNLKLVSYYPNVPELSIFKLHQKTAKHTMMSMLLGGTVRFRNLPFLLIRGLYVLKRYFLILYQSCVSKGVFPVFCKNRRK